MMSNLSVAVVPCLFESGCNLYSKCYNDDKTFKQQWTHCMKWMRVHASVQLLSGVVRLFSCLFLVAGCLESYNPSDWGVTINEQARTQNDKMRIKHLKGELAIQSLTEKLTKLATTISAYSCNQKQTVPLHCSYWSWPFWWWIDLSSLGAPVQYSIMIEVSQAELWLVTRRVHIIPLQIQQLRYGLSQSW